MREVTKDDIAVFQGDITSPFVKKYIELYERQQQQLWVKSMVSVMGDVIDYKTLSPDLSKLFEELFLAFTSYDINVGTSYSVILNHIDQNETHKTNMLTIFNYCETIHNTSYSFLTETLGFNGDFYKRFREIPQLSNKILMLIKSKPIPLKPDGSNELEHRKSLMKYIFVMSGMVEGVVLMSLFSILLMFSTDGKFQGMASINKWSIRDEDLHIIGNSVIFREEMTKLPDGKLDDEFKNELIDIARDIVEEEKIMIRYLLRNIKSKEIAISQGSISEESHFKYLQYLLDEKLGLFGLREYTPRPLPKNYEFLELMLGSSSITDFFTNTVTDYVLGVNGTKNTMGEYLDKEFGNA